MTHSHRPSLDWFIDPVLLNEVLINIIIIMFNVLFVFKC